MTDELKVKQYFDDPALFLLQYNKVSQLSEGELRYAEIKLVLNSDVKFILLDEPFNGISPLSIEHVKVMIRECAIHKGIILTDHNYRNVLDVANRHYLLSDGGLKKVNDLEDLAFRRYIPNFARR